jgi:hypothetical protein
VESALSVLEEHWDPIVTFQMPELRYGDPRRELLGPCTICLIQEVHDDYDVRRLRVSWSGGSLELLPTKGLSIGRYFHDNWDPFWDPVVLSVISPDREQLTAPLLVEGRITEGMRWLENFSGCIELLGLSNWGMPEKDTVSGRTKPLHGEAARIPVDSVGFSLFEDLLRIEASFNLNSRWWMEPEGIIPWYRRGYLDWNIKRTIFLHTRVPGLEILDRIRNISTATAVPDWGYHFQLRARSGAQLEIPSRRVVCREGDEPEDPRWNQWTAAKDETQREERGYIHLGLEAETGPLGTDVVRGFARYPGGPDTRFTIPAASCTLSWFSCGGGKSLEFARPEASDQSMMPLPWDGMGPEIGSSPLDPEGIVDQAINHQVLAPGEDLYLYSSFERVEQREK